MNQVNWTFVSNTGKKYELRILHGEKTGHVLILNNMKVLRIDFKVLESKNYSFFIDDELIEIKIHKEEKAFSYSFDIDHDTDTPLNRAKKIQNKKFWIYTAAFFIFLGVVIFGFKAAMQSFNSKMSNETYEILLESQGIDDMAIIFVDSLNHKIKYTFISSGVIMDMEMSYTAFDIQNSPLFPLVDEQTYMIRYVPTKPSVHRIDFNRPDQKTLNGIFAKCIQRHAQFNPDLNQTNVECEVEATYKHYGLSGLANIFYQNESESFDQRSNRKTFEEMKQSALFNREVIETCK